MGSTSIETPQAPAAPTVQDSAASYAASLPAIYQAQLQYEPLMAQQAVDLAGQYALPYSQALKTVQDTLYPGTSSIQENLAKQSLAGMTEEVPDWMKNQYRDNYMANVGTNAGSPIAADGVSTGLMSLQKEYNDYYRNLGLTLANRQPLQQTSMPQGLNYMQGYQPAQGLNYSANTYGSYAGLYGQMYNANSNRASARDQMWGQIAGSAAGAGGAMGAAMLS